MTSFNGAKHDVEDILESIRTSISDRAPILNGRSEPRAHAMRPELAEELPDFELPAIFKPAPKVTNERPNLLGRLSEALSSESAADRSRTVIRFEPANGRMNEQAAAAQKATKSAERSATEMAGDQQNGMKREMPSFFDTRLNRMGELTKVAPQPQAQPAVRQATLSQPLPPNLPSAHQIGEDGAMEDAAAQLLRPILKQWLTENMPKIVEKALRNENDDDRGSGGGFSRR